jgi:hypothetical protein
MRMILKQTSLDLSYSAEALFSIELMLDSNWFNCADFFDNSSAKTSNCFRSLISLLFKNMIAESLETKLSSC